MQGAAWLLQHFHSKDKHTWRNPDTTTRKDEISSDDTSTPKGVKVGTTDRCDKQEYPSIFWWK
jgi:hypothetical protein